MPRPTADALGTGLELSCGALSDRLGRPTSSIKLCGLVTLKISLKSQKMLWARAAGRCSKSDCRLNLYEGETETDDPTLIGENCHIVAESDGGPRSDPSMPMEKRNLYSNLILLCRNHHKIIDAQASEYTVTKLRHMKLEHEAWVEAQLGFDKARQIDEVQYASMIDQWERLAHVDTWTGWTSGSFFGGQPAISVAIDRDLFELRTWLFNRVWSGRCPELESALQNFRFVLDDFQETFRQHARPNGDRELMTEKFYKIDHWNEDLYRRLVQQYEFHVDLVQDLTLELTRASNLVCDRVRRHLFHSYRLEEGRLFVQLGPTVDDLRDHAAIIQYDANERQRDAPYPGLPKFLIERSQRDYVFGKGTEP